MLVHGKARNVRPWLRPPHGCRFARPAPSRDFGSREIGSREELVGAPRRASRSNAPDAPSDGFATRNAILKARPSAEATDHSVKVVAREATAEPNDFTARRRALR